MDHIFFSKCYCSYSDYRFTSHLYCVQVAAVSNHRQPKMVWGSLRLRPFCLWNRGHSRKNLTRHPSARLVGCRSLSANLLDVIETWYTDSWCANQFVPVIFFFFLESFDEDLHYTWVWWISRDVPAKSDKQQSDSDRVVSDRSCHCIIEADNKPGQVSLIGPHASAESSFFFNLLS